MATTTGEIIAYPIVKEDALEVDPVYKQLQAKGPIKVKLPFGEPCWLATRYQDVRTVYSGPTAAWERIWPTCRSISHWRRCFAVSPRSSWRFRRKR